MSNDDDPFTFRNWRDEIHAVSTTEGPFATATIDAELNSKLHHGDSAPLILPDLETFAYGQLEDIAPETFSSSDVDDHIDPPTEDDLWSIPDSLTIDHAPKLRTWTAFLDPTHVPPPPSLLSESNPAFFDAVLSELPSDPQLTLDTPFIITCLSLAAQGHASPLFSRGAGSTTFQPFDDGAFRAFGLSPAVTQSLVRKCTAIGEALLGLQGFVNRTQRAKEPAKARVALSTCIREVLELDRRRVREVIGKVRGVVALQSVFDVSEVLVGVMLRLRDVCLQATHDCDAVLLVHEEIRRLSTEFSPLGRTLDAVDVAITRPVVERLTCDLGLRPKSATDYFVSDTYDESMLNGLLGEQDRLLVGEIGKGLDMLRTGDSSHPLVQGVGQPVLRDLFSGNALDSDPDRILSLARRYEETVKAALAGTQSMDIDILDYGHSAEASYTSSDDATDAFKAAFVDLGAQFVTLPNTQDVTGHDHLQTAFEQDIQSYNTPDPGHVHLASDEPTILSPLRSLLAAQARLVTSAVQHQIFTSSNLISHLTLARDHLLFNSGPFILRLQTALFDPSTSSSTHSTLFGLRLSAPAPTWPPTSSALRLALAGILPSRDHLSFSIRNLSDPEIAEVLDPCSPHALDFLKLTYTPPPGLAFFFTQEVLGKYDSISRFSLSLLRQTHLVAALSSSLPSQRGQAHLFALEARTVVAALASSAFDIGIAPVWAEFISSLNRETMAVSQLVARHVQALDAIRSRLLLSARWTSAHAARGRIFAAVLKGARAVLASDADGVGAARRELKEAKEELRLALRKGTAKGRGREEMRGLEVLGDMLS